jgi:dihydroneopterin aldolase
VKDKILLKNITIYAHLGVTEKERAARQKIGLDIEFSLDLQAAGRTDNLEKTIDYAKVYSLMKERIEKKEYRLLEALAEDIAAEVLGNFSIDEVLVRARKPQVKLAGPLDYVAVEIKRRK